MVLILILMAVRIEPMAGVAQDPLGILTTNLFHGFIQTSRILGRWGLGTMGSDPIVFYYIPLVGLDASVSNLTREAVIEHPLFTPFRAESDAMHSTNLFAIADADYRAQLRAKFLGDAIPATSFAAGANEISGNAVCGNINYADCRSGTWPIGEGKWRHSDIKNVAYFFNWKLFKLIINSDRGVSNANQQ